MAHWQLIYPFQMVIFQYFPVRKLLVYHFPIFSNIFQYFPIFSNIFQYFPISYPIISSFAHDFLGTGCPGCPKEPPDEVGSHGPAAAAPAAGETAAGRVKKKTLFSWLYITILVTLAINMYQLVIICYEHWLYQLMLWTLTYTLSTWSIVAVFVTNLSPKNWARGKKYDEINITFCICQI